LRGLTIQRVASALSADRPKTPFFRGPTPPLRVVFHPERWKRLKVRTPPLSGPVAYLHGSGTFPGLDCRIDSEAPMRRQKETQCPASPTSPPTAPPAPPAPPASPAAPPPPLSHSLSETALPYTST